MSKIFALAIAAMITAASPALARWPVLGPAHVGWVALGYHNTISVNGRGFGAIAVTAIELPR
jgi:hypothetical protein